MEEPVERIFPADPASLSEIRSFVRTHAMEATFGTELAEELTLAVSEAASNSILHTQTTSIRLEARLDGNTMVVEVEDEGTFDSRMPIPELDDPGGRGILLMTAFADEVAILEGTPQDPGTTVRLVKRKPSPAG
jgi:anti-sigma regulatory factor (Ser/Thr protein kinase)